jgi:hypothetical protein
MPHYKNEMTVTVTQCKKVTKTLDELRVESDQYFGLEKNIDFAC